MMRPSTLLVLILATASASPETLASSQAASPPKEAQKRMDRDIEVIDDYLAKWDRFARGEKSLVPDLNRDGAAFGAALGRALKAKDKRAPGRLVFSVVVQVGGGIPVDSDLGKDARPLLGPDFPIVEGKKDKVYFASDLYFWWLDHRQEYESYPRLRHSEKVRLRVRKHPSPRELAGEIGTSGDVGQDAIDNQPRYHVAQFGISNEFPLAAHFGCFGIID
jgi:hypothetical protein